MNVALNTVDMAETLKYAIENNKTLAANGKMPIAYELIGEAGTAKSSIVEQVAAESGMDFVKINASQVSIDDK
jgi:ATP-dependent Zn protease